MVLALRIAIATELHASSKDGCTKCDAKRMIRMTHLCLLIQFFSVAVLSFSPPDVRAGQARPAQNTQRVSTAAALSAFRRALDKYMTMRRDLERTLPPLPTQADAAKIDEYELALGKLITRARSHALQGDLFVPEVRPLVLRLCRKVLTSPDGRAALEEIGDESLERSLQPRINERYPDGVPLSAVPYQLLKILPPLPDELEYRFLGEDLILIDIDARIIVDFLRHAIPR